MYLGFDYHFALVRQAELIRSAEHQRKVNLLRASQHRDATVRTEAHPRTADREAAPPINKEEAGQRRAS